MGQYNHPPPYSIQPELQTTNDGSCEMSDDTNNETDNESTTSAKNTLGEKLGRFRRNGEDKFEFKRFQ